ncbi:MAG: sugar ABC transporter permease [Fibrobacter sp.]|jgi:ABC-type sugar transport system permease subunit|nr:sugar ABC transporter permease [Fibrobacter sp.]
MIFSFFGKLSEWIKRAWPLIPATLYLSGFQIVVFVYLGTLSLSDQARNIDFPSIQPIVELFSDKYFRQALLNTFLFTLVGTPLELLSGLFLALLLYQSFFLRGFIRSIFLIPLAIPALVTAMLLYILFDYPGGHINHLLIGNYPPLPAILDQPINWRGSAFFAMGISLLGKVWRDMPISMLILLAGLNSIDPELFDAAKTMGASLRKRIFSIMLPLIIPAISTVLLLRTVEMWKEFIFPYILAGRYRLLGTLIDFYYYDVGNSHKAAAVAMIMVLCILVSTFLILRTMDLLQKAAFKR